MMPQYGTLWPKSHFSTHIFFPSLQSLHCKYSMIFILTIINKQTKKKHYVGQHENLEENLRDIN